MSLVLIGEVEPLDAGELLTLQRAAYVSEAQLYGDPLLPPLTETLDELRAAFVAGPSRKAMLDGRIVGSVRSRAVDRALHIGRLVVAPDLQGRGIGTRLLAEVEAAGGGGVDRYTLFTGDRSTANIRRYRRLGYVEVRREPVGPDVTLVHLEKPVVPG